MGKSDDDDQTMAHASQENQSDHSSGTILPIKKRRENTTPGQSETQGPGPDSSYVRKSSDGKYDSQNRTKPSDDAGQKVDDKQKEPEKTHEHKVDKIPLEKAPHQNERKGPEPSFGFPYVVLGPGESQCLSKTLNCQDVNPANPELCLDAYEASILIDSPEIVEDPPVDFSENLLVVDEDNRIYYMKISQYKNGQWTFYSITEDWKIFVSVHKLKAGDEISFYRKLDDLCDDYYYTLKYVRKSSDSKDDAQNCKIQEESASVSSKEMAVLKIEYNKASLENTPDEKKENVSWPGSSFSPDQDIHLHRPLPRESRLKDLFSSYKVEVSEVPLGNTSDRKKRKAQGPGSRTLTSEDYCLSKTLSSYEVVQENPKLYFHPYDAIILTGFRELIGYSLGEYSKDLLVYDVDNMAYNMNLSHYISGWKVGFCLNTDWNRFLTTHNLKEGDRLTFYKFLDTSVSDDYYYVLKYVRKNTSVSPDREHKSEVEDNEVSSENARDRKRRKVEGPGSRDLTRADYCLSKTLSSLEVSQENPRLYLDAHNATSLSDSNGNVDYPLGRISKNLAVFDEDDMQYDILLSHFLYEGKIMYTFDAGWQRFVRVHNLKGGDDISIYRILDKCVCDEYYYIIKCIRKTANP